MSCKTDKCIQGRDACATPDECKDDGVVTFDKVVDAIWSALAGIGAIAVIVVVSFLLGYYDGV